MESYYDLLGVPPLTATTEQINAAYRRVTKAYHPDLGATGEKMKRLNDAHEILTDAAKRRAYDNELLSEVRESTSPGWHYETQGPPPPSSSKPGFAKSTAYAPTRGPESTRPKDDLYWVYFRSRPWPTLFPIVLVLTYFYVAPPFAAHSDFFRNVAGGTWFVFLVIPGAWVSWFIKWLWGRHVSRGLAKSSSTKTK
jgi:curved DNA-binding protein CbpA